MKKTFIYLMISLGMIFFSGIADADEGKSEKNDEDLTVEAEIDTRYIPKTKADSQSGKVGVTHSASKVNYTTKIFGKVPFKFGVDSRYIGIDNSTAVELPSSLTSIGGNFEITGPFFALEDAYIRAEFSPSLYGSHWNFRSSGFRCPMYYYGIYKPNEQWTYIAGVGVTIDFEREVFPIFGFIYKPNDKLLFRITPRHPTINYNINSKITIFAEGDLTYGEYEVDRDGQKNVVLQYSESSLGAGVKYRMTDSASVSISCGEVFGRQLKYRDGNGKVNIKSAPYVNLKFKVEI